MSVTMNGADLSPMGRWALAYSRRGLAVFPLRARSKVPATMHGLKDATHDPRRLREWWEAWPDANIAVATGEPSGVWVLDIDEGGESTLDALTRTHGPLPETAESITANGRHLWFLMPPDARIANSVRRLGEGIDTRATGGYVVVPPSIHPTGRAYAWSVDAASTIAPTPQWIIDALKEVSKGERKPAEYWASAFAAGITEGRRNDHITRLAGHLHRHYLDPDVVLLILLDWNAGHCFPPLPVRDVETICASVLSAELAARDKRPQRVK